jgi:hypothetical protein
MDCSAGTVPHVRIGCLGSREADRPKVIFLAEKIRRAWLNLIRRKGCYLAKSDSFLDRIIRVWYPVRQESSA